jgi:DNA (cytosine-5)-methyltransferase 1
VQSWKNPNKTNGKYKQQYIYLCPKCASRVEPYYYCAANAIDWNLPVQRIGDRTRPLKPKTLARIEAGLKKFARTGFMVETAYSHAPDNRFKGVEEPLPTQAARQTQGVVVPPFLLNTTQRNQDSGFIRGLTEASFTQTTGQTMGVAIPPFIMEHIHEYRAREISEALSTVIAEGNHHSVVVPPMVVEAWNTSTASPVMEALAAVVAGGNHHYLLMPPFLMGNYTPGTHREITDALGTVTTQDHHSLITPPALLMGLGGASGSRRDSEMSEAFPTQTGTRQFGMAVPPFLTSYYGTDSSRTLDEPVGTVTTLDRHALVSPETETIRVEDCGFRMLQPHEIQNAMAFPGSYKVLGNSRDKVKQLGNAVTPPIMQMLIERCLATFN